MEKERVNDEAPITNEEEERLIMISEIEAIIIVFKQSTQQLLSAHKSSINTAMRFRDNLIRKCGEVYLALDRDRSLFDEVNRIMMEYFEMRIPQDAEKLKREVLRRIGEI